MVQKPCFLLFVPSVSSVVRFVTEKSLQELANLKMVIGKIQVSFSSDSLMLAMARS